ncbi:PTS lactose/cellobiose transporter subunit IIA [Mesoplasma photuris]|uniref:PTS lactose/cellobiose transporter subunit IIA n=1 Tax=Mesoplasma photuris TaxID=217731 RepID=UPI0004E13DE9|nr:PTS lactose/cellobiose transporter subunit IIA [Mesoplasma photuris]
MLNYEKIAFGIISSAGSAKSYAFEAISEAEDGNYDQANKLIELGREDIIKAEQVHMETISFEAQGNKLEFSILLMHAEDQMMSAQMLLEMAEKFINVYEKMEAK